MQGQISNRLTDIFGENVRERTRKQYDGVIPHDDLTYKQLHSFVQKVEMKICRDEKLAYQRQKERKQVGKELEIFCEQFDYQYKKCRKTKKSKYCNG